MSGERRSSGSAVSRGAWPRPRRRVALLAVGTAALTGAVGVGLGGTDWHAWGAAVHLAAALAALLLPTAIVVQVVAGQVLVGTLLLGPGGPGVLALLPVVGGVVATAELLGAVARLDTPTPRPLAEAVGRATPSAAVGAAAFGVVSLVGGLPGPSGVLAVLLASAACVVPAVLLARRAGDT